LVAEADRLGLEKLKQEVASKLDKQPYKGGRLRKKLTAEQRAAKTVHLFISRIAPNESTGCWDWIGAALLPPNLPYGRYKFHGREYKAHNCAYALFVAPVPADLWVLHECDNPMCVNPDHLKLGTPKQNTQDCISRGRFRKAFGRRKSGFGTDHPHAKLNDSTVLEIRATYKRGDYVFGARPLARKFGVSKPVITAVVRRITWRHV